MVIDETGDPVFLAQGGSANLATNSEITLKRSLQKALIGAPAVHTTCACFAGLVTDERRQEAHDLITSLVTSRKVRIEPDYAAALRACQEGTTACVIAGTGSVVCSRAGGMLVKSGGGGYLLGDEGSGFQYGRAALAAYIRRPDEASLAVQQAVTSLFETSDRNEIIERVYSLHAPASLFAGLATAFTKDAQNNLPYAINVLRSQSLALADVVVAHLTEHHPEIASPLIGLAGGLWKRGVFRQAFDSAVHELCPLAKTQKSEMPPVRGAALLAMESL